MNGIKEWAMGITLISFAGGIAFILLPKGSTAKTVKSVISVIIILSCVIPFSGSKKFEPELYTENYFSGSGESDISNAVNRQQLEFVEGRLKDEIEKILKKHSAKAMRILIEDNIGQDGRIEINKVEVYLNKECSHLVSDIRDDILSVLGIETEVMISDSENLTLNEKEVDG